MCCSFVFPLYKFIVGNFNLLFVFFACEEDQKEPSYEKQALLGKWELTEAWRNNRKTETLVGTFYEFEETGKMRTNFPLDMVHGEYEFEFDGREIIQKGKLETIYKIDTLTNSTLIFSTTFNKSSFKLAFGKHIATESDGNSEL